MIEPLTSHVRGECDPPLMEETIGVMLATAARRWPEVDALVSVEQGVRWSFGELNNHVDAMAAGFVARGLRRGDRVAICAPNCAEWVTTQFATARVGIILVNVNPAYRTSELEFTLNTVRARALIIAHAFKSSDYVKMIESLAPEIALAQAGRRIIAARLPHLELVAKIGGDRRRGWLEFGALCAAQQHPEAKDLETDNRQAVNIQFTSGTTGSPKGATLSHRNLVNNAYFVGRSMGLRAGDRLCVPVPLYHCFGMVMSNLACVIHGATIVYASPGFDAGAVLRAVSGEKCTALHGVPTMFIAELQHPEFERADLSSLRAGIMAGSPCPVEIMRRVIDRMHMREVTIAYGMTETSPVSFQSLPDDPLERRVSTVGRIQPHMQAKVIDADGNLLPRGAAGELCTRGYAVMLGYWEDPERTAEAIDAEGWMHTGDLAVIDDEGYCNIVGRRNDMIIRGGENVYPREIEELLFQHPIVADVAVVGVPHDKWGEEVCACIVVRAGFTASGDEIHVFCRERIAHYKVPTQIEFVAALPMTVTGKVQKFVIREQLAAKLGRIVQGIT